MPLSGQHAFVTGGGRGIGRAIAAALARAGAAVTVIGRSEAPLRAAVAAGAAAGCAVADVTDAAALKRQVRDRKSTRLNSSHPSISYAVFCLKKKSERKDDRGCPYIRCISPP